MPRWNNNMNTREEIIRVKRNAVLREAGQVFSKRGYHNTSLDEVAEALKVSKGTLYNYVRDKQDILYELHRIAMDIGDKAQAAGEAQEGSAAARLRTTIREYIRMFTDEMGACIVLSEIDALRPEDRQVIVERRDGFFQNHLRLIEEGIADGSLRTVNPHLAVFVLMGAVNWIPRWYSQSGALSGEGLK